MQNYDPINSYYQGAAGGSYRVNQGDTLQRIAQSLYGDSSLWYKIAEANGLSAAAALVEGQTLVLPTGVLNSKNNAGTFKPYNAGEAIGDLSPSTPQPPKNAKNKCGVFGMILLAVIAIAVTALTYGALGGTALSAWAAVGAGAVAGAAGSIASQAVGVATGIQDKFSFKGVALAAIGGAIGGGLGPKGLFGANGAFGNIGSQFVGDALRGAVGSTLTQGVGVATGLQDKFSWAGVAAAGIGAGIGGAVGRGLESKSGLFGVSASAGSFGYRMATSAASGIANAATRSAINGESFGKNLIAALPDIIGQAVGGAIGSALVTGIKRADVQRRRYDRIDSNGSNLQERLGSQADVKGFIDASKALADDPRNPEAQKNVEYELRKLIFANRDNAAVKSYIDQIGSRLPEGYLASPEDIIITGNRDYLLGSLIDNSGIWLGEKKAQLGEAVGKFIEDNPAAGIAATIFDTGMAAIAPAKYIIGFGIDYFKEGLSDWVAGKMEGTRRWSTEKAAAGGDGVVLGASIITTGLGGVLKTVNGTGTAGIPKIGGRLPINSKYAGQIHPSGVRFTEQGFPDFGPYAKAEVKLSSLTGVYRADERLANAAVGLKKTPKGFVWHHVEDGVTLQLIPKSLNSSVKHTGGAAVIRNGGFDQ